MAEARTGIGRSGPLNPTWFAIAIQALVTLARAEGVCPSAAIADRVRSHAVFLRRILAQLARAGMVEAREGRDGGYRLARSPETITLSEVYLALKAAEFPALQVVEAPPPHAAAALGGLFCEIAQRVDDQIVQVLADYSLADLLARAADTDCPPS